MRLLCDVPGDACSAPTGPALRYARDPPARLIRLLPGIPRAAVPSYRGAMLPFPTRRVSAGTAIVELPRKGGRPRASWYADAIWGSTLAPCDATSYCQTGSEKQPEQRENIVNASRLA